MSLASDSRKCAQDWFDLAEHLPLKDRQAALEIAEAWFHRHGCCGSHVVETVNLDRVLDRAHTGAAVDVALRIGRCIALHESVLPLEVAADGSIDRSANVSPTMRPAIPAIRSCSILRSN